MINSARQAAQNTKPGSITQVIANAVNVVIAQPLLMIVPILVDLYYLVGWKVTPGGTFDRLQTASLDLGTEDGTRLAGHINDFSGADFTELVSFVVPSFLAGASSQDIFQPVTRTVVNLDNWGLLLLVVVGLIALSMVIFGGFGLWLADAGLNRPRSWRERLRLAPALGGRFILMLLLIVAMVLLLCVPLMFAMIGALLVGIALDGLVLSLTVLVGLALYVLFYFAPDALLVDFAGPAQALRASSKVVRRNLLATVGFAVVSIVITIGVADIWDRLASNAPGLALAIVANAFVGCSLSIASLLFFSERSKLIAREEATSTA